MDANSMPVHTLLWLNSGCNRVANLCGNGVQLLHKGATMMEKKKKPHPDHRFSLFTLD